MAHSLWRWRARWRWARPPWRSAVPAEHREEPLLVGRIRRNRLLLAEGARRAERRYLRLDDLTAGPHKGRIEVRVLAGGHGQVPAMDEHVEHAVPGIDRAGHRPVGHGTRRVQGAWPAECRRRCRRRGGVGSSGIGAEHITVEAVS